jgi:hypothetical protein
MGARGGPTRPGARRRKVTAAEPVRAPDRGGRE